MKISSLSLFSQQLISFETTEGYIIGDFNGQNGYSVTVTTVAPPILFFTGQVISTKQAKAGTNSFKVADEPLYGPQTNAPVICGFYTLPTAASGNSFTVSFDTRINLANGTDWVYRGLTMTTPTPSFVYYLNFSYDGTVLAGTVGATGITAELTTATWLPNIWYRVKIIGTATAVQYYVDDVLVYTGTALTSNPGALDRMDFVHDNYGGDHFIDRIAINNEAVLATNDVISINNQYAIYPNPTTDFLIIKTDEKVKSETIFDMADRKMDAQLSDNKVDVKNLESGAYIINVETTKGNSTEKFIKK